MSEWTCFTLTPTILFLLLALIMALLKDKSALLISGFNTLSKEEKERYDTHAIIQDQIKEILIWAVILGLGTILSYLFSWIWAPVFFMVWLVVFFSNVHLDVYKAYERYKK